eukprot:SAG11_NODE_19110_length_474_cov_0.674667_1_plen_45_part_01
MTHCPATLHGLCDSSMSHCCARRHAGPGIAVAKTSMPFAEVFVRA